MSRLNEDSAVSEIMTADVATVSEHAYLSIAEVMRDSIGVRHLPVVDIDDKPIGIVSIRDILEHYKTIGADGRIPVGEVMTSPVLNVEPSTKIKDVAKLMKKNNVSSVIIVDGVVLSGIVTERDFLKVFLD